MGDASKSIVDAGVVYSALFEYSNPCRQKLVV